MEVRHIVWNKRLPVILAIDIGTTSIRGVLFDEHGSPLDTRQVVCQPIYRGEGVVEQEPHTWSETVAGIVRSLCLASVDLAVSIDALSLTSQRSSVMPVDRAGEPLHAANMWQDTRSRNCCAALDSECRNLYERTGQRLSPVLAGPKIWWFRTQHPEIYERAHKFLTVADYILHFITGRFITDTTYGSRTLLMGLSDFAWDQELLELFHIDHGKLCELVSPGSVVGNTSEAFERLTGLRSGTPVISAGGDQQCGALGAGVLDAGSAQVTSGTGSYILAPTNALTLDPEMQFLCSASAVPGRYLAEASVLTTSVVYAWLGKVLLDEVVEPADMFRTLEQEAATSAPGAGGVLALPHFQGSGSPYWNPHARGVFVNLSLSTQRCDLIRAVLEGVAADLADNLDTLRERLGAMTTISVSGGLSRVALFNEIQATMFGQSVQVPANSESTTLGAWVSGAVAIGLYGSYTEALAHVRQEPCEEYQPVDANSGCYKDLRRRRRVLYDALAVADIGSRSSQLKQGEHA